MQHTSYIPITHENILNEALAIFLTIYLDNNLLFSTILIQYLHYIEWVLNEV